MRNKVCWRYDQGIYSKITDDWIQNLPRTSRGRFCVIMVAQEKRLMDERNSADCRPEISPFSTKLQREFCDLFLNNP